MITKERIVEVLKSVNDPEIGLDIYTLGLIYDIKIEKEKITIKMTFTTPMCPYGPMLINEVKDKLKSVDSVKSIDVDLVFEPLWQPSKEVKLMLGIED